MAHCDSAFYIGKSHDICEDYATTFSTRNNNQVVLCDGCSSSDMVDVGARILSLEVAKLLDKHEGDINENVIKNFAVDFFHGHHEQFIKHHTTMFDATTLFIRDDNLLVQVGVIGDGVVACKMKNGEMIVIDYQSGNMPRYLSYSWNEERHSLYMNAGVKYYYDRYTNAAKVTNILTSFYNNMYFDKSNIEWVAVMSDGVHSFRDSQNNPVDFMEVIKAMTGFKMYAGRFVQRRLNGFRKECAKLGWVHDDDISIGCLYTGE